MNQILLLDRMLRDAAAKSGVLAALAMMMSFANGDKTKTFCIYEGPTEAAIRQAALANHLPVDTITEVPVTLDAH